MNHACARSILLLEDDDRHARLLERHLRRCGLGGCMMRVADSDEAIRYLGRARADGGRSSLRPGLILRDIRMPRRDGFDVLMQIRADSAYRHTPVSTLASTDSQQEIDHAYRPGASGHVVKPVDAGASAERVSKFGGFLGVLELPGQLCVGTSDGRSTVG